MTYRLINKTEQPVSSRRLRELMQKFREVSGCQPDEKLSGIITGKGEPLLASRQELGMLIQLLAQNNYTPELQTNGALLDEAGLIYFKEQGLATVALSCVSHSDEINSQIMAGGRVRWALGRAARQAADLGLLVRLTAILTRGGVDSPDGFLAFMRWAKEIGAKQVTLRKMGEPRNLALPGSMKIARWIRKNYVDPDFIVRILQARANELEPWPWAMRFDYKGISIVITDHLTAPGKGKVRHGVIQPDGHLYGSWDDPKDIIA
jgi:hypothetical protein